MRDGHNNYGPSAGIAPARDAVAAEYTSERVSDLAGPRVHHRGHIRRHRADPRRRRRCRRRGAGADADLSAVHRGARQARRHGEVLPPRRLARLDAGSRSSQEPGHAGDPRAGGHRSQQPDRRGVFDGDAPRAARFRRPARPADPRRRGLRRSRLRRADRAATASSIRTRRSSRSPSLSKAYLAPGWRTGWMACRTLAAPGRRRGGGEKAGGRPAVQHRADAIRDCRGADRRPLASAGVPRGR